MSFKFGDRVEIGGRTMLRPGFSLVGLAGMAWFPTAPGAPAGTVSVLVDWLAFDYTEENGYPADSLPPIVNVPAEHLFLLEENPATWGIKPPKILPNPDAIAPPKLGIIGGDGSRAHPEPSDEPAPAPDEDEEPPRPSLRLL